MRKFVAVLLVMLMVVIVGVSFARVTLTPATVQTFQTGGVTVETADVAAVTFSSIDFQAQTMQINVSYGTWVGGAFVPSNRSAQKVVLVNLTPTVAAPYGTYNVSDGTGGNVPQATSASIKIAMAGYRNSLESLSMQAGLMSGTVANW